jgi:monofunctional biosynthetic peptidoglycan transglycosylase
MQTAKNLFLWPSRSVLRKGMEIPLALALDFFWSKRRVMEVYLNVAEWGPNGEFGAEAAARAAFGKSAASLTLREAALLATSLPNPLKRLPGRPRAGQVRLAERVAVRVGQSGPWLDCLRH